MTKHISVLLTYLLFVAGCGQTPSSSSTKTTDGGLTVTRSQFFNQHTKHLEPHLGFSSGAVDYRYSGNGNYFSSGVEIWKNGIVIQPVSWSSASFDGPALGTIRVSLLDVSEYTDLPKYKLTVAMTTDSGSASSTSRHLPKHEIDATWGSAMDIPADLNA
jgi:hypothetical protein